MTTEPTADADADADAGLDLPGLKRSIDDALDQHLPRHSDLAPDLVAAMRYAALGNGKRLRPMLVCAAACGVGGDLMDALAPACAVELVHAYSLIHDDLPAMDNDDLRHGLPSCHVRFGEATAILAGDALQSLAFELLAAADGLGPDQRVQAVACLARAIGVAGMAGGQSRDMMSEGKRLSLSEIQTLHGAKTGALITAAVQIGALVGRASDEQYVLLTEFARRVGVAFQIIDDVLDITESTEQLGKPAGSDAAASKSTYPSLLGVREARVIAEELLAEALPMLSRAGVRQPWLGDLAKMAVRRDH